MSCTKLWRRHNYDEHDKCKRCGKDKPKQPREVNNQFDAPTIRWADADYLCEEEV